MNLEWYNTKEKLPEPYKDHPRYILGAGETRYGWNYRLYMLYPNGKSYQVPYEEMELDIEINENWWAYLPDRKEDKVFPLLYKD